MKTNRQFDDMVARNSSLEERNIHLHELLEDANHKLEVLGSFSVFTSQPDRYELRKIISEQAVEITQLLKRITELEVNLNALQTKYEELADDYIDLKESK